MRLEGAAPTRAAADNVTMHNNAVGSEGHSEREPVGNKQGADDEDETPSLNASALAFPASESEPHHSSSVGGLFRRRWRLLDVHAVREDGPDMPVLLLVLDHLVEVGELDDLLERLDGDVGGGGDVDELAQGDGRVGGSSRPFSLPSKQLQRSSRRAQDVEREQAISLSESSMTPSSLSPSRPWR